MIGIDEVGRGAWAGPLVVAGCYFTENPGFVHGLDDSKKLSSYKREQLVPLIQSSTIHVVVTISSKDVDIHGLTASIRTAILHILEQMPEDVTIMLDGKYNFLRDTIYEERTIVEVAADAKYPSVMAASILAKDYRDKHMKELHKTYPLYGFATNVGYGTEFHKKQLLQHGLSPIHRLSFQPMKEMAT